MSRTTDLYLQKEKEIQDLLYALDNASDDNIVWLVNQLQKLGYNFSQSISDNELSSMGEEF